MQGNEASIGVEREQFQDYVAVSLILFSASPEIRELEYDCAHSCRCR